MSDFHYEFESVDHYSLNTLDVDGKTIQNGTPSTSTPINPESITTIAIANGSETIAIDLQGNPVRSVPSEYRDRLSIDASGNVKLIKNTASVLVDGSANRIYSVSSFSGHTHALVDMGNGNLPSATNKTYVFCDKLPNMTGNEEYLSDNGIATANNRFIRFVNPAIEGMTQNQVNTWLQSNNLYILYPLLTPVEINLGVVDISALKNLDEIPALSLISNVETTFSDDWTNIPTNEITNPYQEIITPDVVFPPRHFGQDWEVFEPDKWSKTEMMDYTGQRETHSVYGIQLCDLIETGVFDWSKPELDWSSAAYSPEQYTRFCNYFIERFYFRDIGITPFKVWANYLHRMLAYELMPKYKPLYNQVEAGITPLGENEYHKRRTINSAYPETQLSGNSDYITDGIDEEYETVHVKNPGEAMQDYMANFESVDKALADELEVLFVCMYTSYVNAL